jgi:membrane-associated phospholipid phosphatase
MRTARDDGSLRPAQDVDAARTGTSARWLSRFTGRAALGLLLVLVLGVPFLALTLLLERQWEPMLQLDGDVALALNEAVSPHPALVSTLLAVTDFGGFEFAGYAMVLATVFLLIRRQRRLAAFVAVTGIGLGVLVPVVKALVDRARPDVPQPVVELPANASFPSGHAMTAIVTWGALVLVALPLLRRSLRPWLVAGGVGLVLVVGLTRLALGVHFVTDVLAGWALGAAWLAAMTVAFRGWQHSTGGVVDEPWDPLDAEPVPHEEAVATGGLAPRGARALRLLVIALGIVGGLAGLGLLIVGPLADGPLGRFDSAGVQAFVEARTPAWTTTADLVGMLSGTRGILAVGLAAAVVIRAITVRWRPVVFVGVAIGGEVLLYWLVAQAVGRVRPRVEDLTSGLPAAASWPSGHVAAAVVTYGAVAALVIAYGRRRARWLILLLPLVVAVLVALSRIYVAAHRPTDTIAGVLLGAGWLLGCAVVLLPRHVLRATPQPPVPSRATGASSSSSYGAASPRSASAEVSTASGPGGRSARTVASTGSGDGTGVGETPRSSNRRAAPSTDRS